MSFAINTDKDKEVISAILEYAKKNFVMKESGVRRADRDDLWRQVGSQHKAKYRRHLFKIIKSFEVGFLAFPFSLHCLERSASSMGSESQPHQSVSGSQDLPTPVQEALRESFSR